MDKRRQAPAMVPVPAVAAATPAITGAVLCAVSLVASAEPMRIKLPKFEMPKVSLPSLPDLDLPGFGKKKEPAAAPKKPAAPRQPAGKVKVRAAEGAVATGSKEEAPTLAELTGQVSQDTIDAGAGWKRFPERRMPGANMDGWKKIAKDITPDM